MSDFKPCPHDRVAEIEAGGKRWHGEDHRVVAVRWEPYKPDGQRQMKAKGRWQEQIWSGDFFKWQNCERPQSLGPDLAAMRAGYDLAAAEAREMGVELRRFELAMNDKGEG